MRWLSGRGVFPGLRTQEVGRQLRSWQGRQRESLFRGRLLRHLLEPVLLF